jgi:hypothetical protein
MRYGVEVALEETLEALAELLKGTREVVKQESPDGETTWRLRRYVERND